MAKILSVKTKWAYNPNWGYHVVFNIETDNGNFSLNENKILGSNKIVALKNLYSCKQVCEDFGGKICTKNKAFEKEQKCEGQFFYVLVRKIKENVK